ncbi:putative mucin/carbohydrate-binding domain-containing protein [Erwinia rhapontici]|uniref:putative mucin/carbohydrate-binding domain-containing protein n=1 Tax=Erwinia rhapontici TaxID=55212 RepID=UPI003BA365EA
MSNITKSISIYTLPRPVWLKAAGMTKGITHDRQHLGIILAAGQSVRIRQSNAAFKEKLTMHLLNDDRKTEAKFSIGNDWVEASALAASVPFIDTPFVQGKPVLEIEYPDNVKILPVFRKGENEAAYFSRWDSQDAEFGLVESEYANLLVPKVSKKDLKALGEAKNIDGLIAYYNRIFSFYNALSGISFEPEHDSDLNIKNRYFIKADKNGVGAAYYGGTCTAESTSSVSRFWLTPKDNNWGPLHEIAHGYQGHFMEDNFFSTKEMWNNIYAACYQDVMLGDRKYKEGWLYDYGNMTNVETKIVELLTTATPLNQWDLRSKLYFAMLMIDKAGKNAFTHFNQQYRKRCNTPGFVPSDHALLDMLSDSFATTGEQVDVTPFIQLAGGHINQTQRNRNLFSHAKAVYPLYQLVDKSQLEAVKTQLKLDSPLRLVDATQLKATHLKGNVSLRFNIDDFAQIYGEDLILMEGARYACKIRISSPTITLSELPIGVYNLRIPGGKDRKYAPSVDYLVVRQGDNKAEINFVEKFSSAIVSQQINLLGLGDDVFATLRVDHARGKLVFDVTTTSPHSYYKGELYARIIVRNQQGKVTLSRDIYGTDESKSHDELAFSAGDQIEIYHAEPQRVRPYPANAGIIDSKNKLNVVTITRTGLKNTALQSDPELALQVQLESAVEQLRHYPQAWYSVFSPFKDDIYLAINTFASPQREQLLARYHDCIPADNAPPGDNAGNTFIIAGKGIYDRQFMTATLNLVQKTLTVKIEAGISHHYFPEAYASLVYEDVDGNILYRDKVIGSQTQKARSVVLPLSGYGGEVIRVHHEEPKNRLIITNAMRGVTLAENGKQQSYRISTVGLERITD